MSGKTHDLAALVSSLGASAVAKKAVDATWKLGSKGKEPPTDPDNLDVDLKEAILFAVLSGVAMGLARLFVARKFAQGERRRRRVEAATGRR